MKKPAIVLIPLLLFVLAIGAFGCGSSDDGMAVEVAKMLPENTDFFNFVDVQQIRDDDDLHYLYDLYKVEWELHVITNKKGDSVSF